MFHDVLDTLLASFGSILVILFSLHYKRHLARQDARKKADDSWRAGVDYAISDNKIAIADLRRKLHAHGAAAGQADGMDSDDGPGYGPGSRLRNS